MAKAGSQAAAHVAGAPRVRGRSPLRQLRHARSKVVPIQRESLEEQVYARLRSSIIDRTIRPGQRISIDRLAQELSISRTPILNALKRLAQERVVECFSRRGIYVRHFSKREMARLFEVREALEGMAARLAAPRIGLAEIRMLRASFRGFDGPPSAALGRRYVERDRHFHWRLVELAGNEQLMAALDSVNMMFFAYQDGVVRPSTETIPEHQAILEALRRHDAGASEAAMRIHIRRSIETLEAEAEAEEFRATEVDAAVRRGGMTGSGMSGRSSGGRRGNARGGRHHEPTTR